MQNKIQEVQKEIKERFLQWQRSAKFPKALYGDSITPELIETAFRQYTLPNLKITLEEYRELYKASLYDYNLNQISSILSMLQNLTPDDLGLNMEAYIGLQSDVHNMTQEWRRIIEPKNAELFEEQQERIKDIQEEEREKQQAAFDKEMQKESTIIEMPIAQA